MKALQDRLAGVGVEVKEQYPLSRHSSFRIGGNAALALFPKTKEQMLDALGILSSGDLPFLILGNASNVVFDDAGFAGAVLFTTAWRELSLTDHRITVSAGTPLLQVAIAARDAALQGLEFSYGIPGSIGGAIYMNSGAFGGSMADVCKRSMAFDLKRNETVTLTGTEQGFGYRTSLYGQTDRYAILGAELELIPGAPHDINTRMNEYMAHRRRTQPLEYPSAGSVFKRPEGDFAGRLIEACGLKGVTVGGAQVSEKHAGFIVNRGNATAANIKNLVELIKERVLLSTGVNLECEIKFL